MRMTMQKAAGGGRCPVRRATVTAALLAACISGCARTPEQAVVALVQRLGGRRSRAAVGVGHAVGRGVREHEPKYTELY